MVFVSLASSAQERRRIPKPKPTEKQPEKKGTPTQQKAAEPEYLPSAFEAIPKPPDHSQWCSLTWQEAPDLAGVKLGMAKQEVFSMANDSAVKLVTGTYDWGTLLEYFNVSEYLLQHPLPKASDAMALVEENMRIAGGERPRPKPVGPPPPKLRVKDAATSTELYHINFGFSNGRLMHVRGSYRSASQWLWGDLQRVFAQQGIPASSWVRHTNIPTSSLDRTMQEMFGNKRYKQTAYCEGFFLTVTYGDGNSANGFILDLINYPTLVQAYKSWKEQQEESKKRFKP
jgi:hypothetical protein